VSIPYSNISRAVALRANQLKGGDAAAREAAYQNSNLITQMDGVEVPYSALKQTILAVAKELAEKIANSNNSLFRAALRAVSASLGSGSDIPLFDANGARFVGKFDAVVDALTGRDMTEKGKREIYRRLENPGEIFVLPSFHFAYEGTRIIHTRPSVVLRGCAWNEIAQSIAYDAQGTSPLPSALEMLWVCKVLAVLPQENWLVQESGVYAQLAAGRETAILNGEPEQLVLPQIPKKEIAADPSKD
jgi:hypothetical protein